MAYVMVEDDTASLELLCFSRVLETCGAYMKENQAVVVKGRLSVRDEKAPQIMCDSIYPLSTVEGGIPEPQPKRETAAGETLFLKFPSIDDPAIRHMKLVFQMFPGKSAVKMVMADTRKVYATQALLHPALVQEAQETWVTKMWSSNNSQRSQKPGFRNIPEAGLGLSVRLPTKKPALRKRRAGKGLVSVLPGRS